MSALTFQEFRNHALKLYHSGAFGETLSYVESHFELFPQERLNLDYFRIAAAARSGQVGHALAVFREVLNTGHWLPDGAMRAPDLQALQGNPAFEEMAQVNKGRFDAASAAAVPQRVTLVPADKGGALPLLIGMHGNGGTLEQGRPFWGPVTELGWQVALVQSSQLNLPGTYNWNDLDKGAAELKQHHAELAGTFDPNRLVLSGFSMGGGLSLRLTLGGEVPARGFVAIGPWLPTAEYLKPYLVSARERGVRGYMVCGQEDAVSLKVCDDIHRLLGEAGIPCKYEIIPGLGHEYPADFDLAKALRFALGEE